MADVCHTEEVRRQFAVSGGAESNWDKKQGTRLHGSWTAQNGDLRIAAGEGLVTWLLITDQELDVTTRT